MSRKLSPNGGNDKIYTPIKLANNLVSLLQLGSNTRTLEPCFGDGAFYKALLHTKVDWCEIDKGKDFFDYTQSVDWIITNPPFSQSRQFLIHSMKLANNIAFLITINHILALKARWRDMQYYGFHPTKVYLIDTPKEFPQSGFQWGFVVIQKTDNRNTEFIPCQS